MGKKNIFTTGLICGLLVTVMAQSCIAYGASLSASADTGSAIKGTYVNVSVDLSNNPSISTLGTVLKYDSSVLKYDSSTWSSDFSGSDMQLVSDTGSEVNLSVVCNDSYSADGTVVTVCFQAVKDTSSIPVTLSLREMADSDLAEVSDCTVASEVQAPEAENPLKENEISNTENADNSSDLEVVEKVVGSTETKGDERDNKQNSGMDNELGNAMQLQERAVSNTDSSLESGNWSDESVDMVQNETDAQIRMTAADEAETSRLDLNYKTGAGIGNDIYLIGAAMFGFLALVLVWRHNKS